MKEPIITQDGICYEEKVLQEHVGRNGYFDPVTRLLVSILKQIEVRLENH